MEQQADHARKEEGNVFTAEEVREHIQFPVLVDIFNKKLGRAMRPTRNFSSAIILFDPDASTSKFDGAITIGLKELIPEGTPGRRMEILLMIIHEMAHFFSKGESDGMITSHGVSRVEDSTSEAISGDAMNEAITELTAIEITREYIRETGDRSYFFEGEDEYHLIAKLASFAYPTPVEALGAAINKISESENVDESATWEAFQHAYYNNDNIAMGNLYIALKKTLGKDAAQQLVRTNVEHMEDPDVRKGILERLRTLSEGGAT